MLIGLFFPLYPALATELNPNNLSTEYYLSYDLENEVIMYSNNIEQAIAPASLTKVMTALVLLDYYQISDSITISLPENYVYSGKVAYLESGMTITIEDLLEFILIYSANDAAHVAAVASTGSVESFLAEMNNKAKSYGMKNTIFLNPDGLDEDGHITTVNDLLKMSLKFIENYRLLAITSKTSFSSDISGSDRIYYSTNQIIKNGYIGIKTGWTSEAGLTFIGLNLNSDRQILTIVNKSTVDAQKSTHFLDTQILYNSSFVDFGYYENYEKGDPIFKLINPVSTTVINSSDTWVDFTDLRNPVEVRFMDYTDGRLSFTNSNSERELKTSESNYKVLWGFKLLEIFSRFAN